MLILIVANQLDALNKVFRNVKDFDLMAFN